MPAPLRRRVRDADDTFALQLARRAARSGEGEALRLLSAAAQARQRVRMRYRSREDAETSREFDTYGLAWRGGQWYAVGHCHLRDGLRSFRLDRVVAVDALPVSFARPEHFDALAHLAFSLATLPRAHRIEVRLHTDLPTAQAEVFDAIGLLQPTNDGVLLLAQADDLDWFARELARLPFAFDVQAPAALRDALGVLAARLQQQAAPGR
jgi:predicted DNA-binding transcriptional regulator YafY